MKRGITILAVLAVLCVFAAGAVAEEAAWVVPDGKVEVWVPLIFDTDHYGERCYRPDLPADVGFSSMGGIVLVRDKADPNYGKAMIARASVFVKAADADRIPQRIPIEQVTLTEKLTVEVSRRWDIRKTTDAKNSTPQQRCMSFFADHANLWAQAEHKPLGSKLLKWAEAKGLPAATVAAIKAQYGL